jgi:hypothetical protein
MRKRTNRGPLTISRNLERQLREQLAIDLSDPWDAHAQKAKYLLDRLDEARKGKK